MTQYLGNAFSLQMITAKSGNIRFSEVSRSEIPADCISVVGHPDTAAVLGVPFNRANLKLEAGDTLYVAQLQGGRLPEGTTTLPEGFSFKYYKLEIE